MKNFLIKNKFTLNYLSISMILLPFVDILNEVLQKGKDNWFYVWCVNIGVVIYCLIKEVTNEK